MKKIYHDKYIYTIQITLALFGSIFAGAHSLGFVTHPIIHQIISIVSALAAISLITTRDTYLPFLGDTVIPKSVIMAERLPAGANTTVRINIPPLVTVVYWASEPGNIAKTPWQAYGTYKNAGVTTSNSEGVAVLRMRPPRAYKTPNGVLLKPHVHYRYFKNGGMLSRVETKDLKSSSLSTT